jgi:RNA polymerase sigma-70 factor (ECF subfamily)
MSRSYKKVYNTVYRLCGHRSDAEDLTQEAFYRAYRSFENYQGDKPFENWIMRIASRLFLDLLRNRKRRITTVSFDAPMKKEGCDGEIHLDIPDKSPGPEREVVDSVLSEDLQLALQTLSSDQRYLIQLADIEGLSYQEIAEHLGTPIGTVRSRLHRTHRLLRSRMDSPEAAVEEEMPAGCYAYLA